VLRAARIAPAKVAAHLERSAKIMRNDIACFLFGIPAVIFWTIGLRKGVMFGRSSRWIRKDIEPEVFWPFAVFYGAIALGLLVYPILIWLGIREL